MIRRIRLRAGSANFCPYNTPSVLLKHTRHTLPFHQLQSLWSLSRHLMRIRITPPHHLHEGRRGSPSTARIERYTCSLQACLFSFQGWELNDLPLRASNESLLIPIPLFEGEWPRLPFTARIERALSECARSASKKGTWPLPHFFPIFATSSK